MNIRYIGATQNSNNHRFALIQYAKAEQPQIDKLRDVLEVLCLYDEDSFEEEESLYISVGDKDDYAEVKRIYLSFKKFKYCTLYKGKEKVANRWQRNLISDDTLYDLVDTDLEIYGMLCAAKYSESDVERIMRNVSGADDAYNSAFEEFASCL